MATRPFERREAEPELSSQSLTRSFQFTIAVDHPALPGHFPGRPLVPGVLLLEHVLAGVVAGSNRQVAMLRQVKFSATLLPGETARVSFEARDARVTFSVDVLRGDASVTLASGSLLLTETDRARTQPVVQ